MLLSTPTIGEPSGSDAGEKNNFGGLSVDLNSTCTPEDPGLSNNMGSTIRLSHSFFDDSDEEEEKNKEKESAADVSVRFSESGTFEASSLAINEAGIISARGQVPNGHGHGLVRKRQVSDFILLKELGRGAGGTVYMAVHAPTLRVVAIKKVKVQQDEKKRQIYREVQALYSNLVPLDKAASMQAPCPYLLTFHGAFTHAESTSINIVLEYMDGGELQGIVDRNERCSEELLAQIGFRLLKGLKFLHSRRQVHRDIKPHNVLLKKDGEVKVSDLGILKELDKNVSLANTWAGTMVYMSPERLKGEAYSYSSDIWSFGLTMFTLATAKLPFENIGGFWAILELFHQNKIPVLPAEDFSEELCDFVGHCLLKDPNQRLTAAQLLHHAFITKHVKTQAIENGDMHSTVIQRVLQSQSSPAPQLASIAGSVGSLSGDEASDSEPEPNSESDTASLSSSLPARVRHMEMMNRRRTESERAILSGAAMDISNSPVSPAPSLLERSNVGVLQPQRKGFRFVFRLEPPSDVYCLFINLFFFFCSFFSLQDLCFGPLSGCIYDTRTLAKRTTVCLYSKWVYFITEFVMTHADR